MCTLSLVLPSVTLAIERACRAQHDLLAVVVCSTWGNTCGDLAQSQAAWIRNVMEPPQVCSK